MVCQEAPVITLLPKHEMIRNKNNLETILAVKIH